MSDTPDKLEIPQPEVNEQEILMNANTVLPVKITQEDKEEFFKAFLSDQPYKETKYFAGGKGLVTFKTLSNEEVEDIYDLIREERDKGIISTDQQYIFALTAYRMGLAIDNINGVPWEPEITKETYKGEEDNELDTYVSAKAMKIKKWTVAKTSILGNLLKEFEDKVVQLVKEIQDENF